MIAAIARHRLGCLGALLALAAGVTLWAVGSPAVAALREHPYFAIDQLVVRGCGPALSADDVRAWLGLDDETTVWEAAPGPVRARLLEHPRIAWARVRRTFPDRLEIAVRERRPQAIAVLDELYYVDRRGGLFGPLAPHDSRDHPFITGLAADAAPGTRRWLLRRALRLLRRCQPERCLGELSEIHVDAAAGVVVYPAAPRLPLRLGWGSWPTKLERAVRVLQAWPGGAERLVSLDLRFRNQVVLSTRPAAAAAEPRTGRAARAVPEPRRAPAPRAPVVPLYRGRAGQVEA